MFVKSTLCNPLDAYKSKNKKVTCHECGVVFKCNFGNIFQRLNFDLTNDENYTIYMCHACIRKAKHRSEAVPDYLKNCAGYTQARSDYVYIVL